ncbi:hypothetical protein F2P81_025825 [Scophthalmus maximus]|uniref:Interferon-induced protein with tetratricopeptide repeats 1-like n=1 Tax=Scophthalmus maximus TaxID=52904 RepID=A0A6A4RSB8_SCOMX|nr:hypothetical protein F2P81_025825 [Scophthalmus maximus]
MQFSKEKKRLAADIFQRAMRMQPDVVEWQTSYVLGLTSLFKHSDTGLEGDDWEKMRQAKEQDPENLFLAAKYLQQLARVLKMKHRMDLASVYAKSNQGLAKSDQIYQELLALDLARDLEPAETQVLFNKYAKYLNSERRDRQRSIKYHMKAAEIPIDSFFRQSSIKTLEKIRDKRRDRMCREIDECLARLEEPQ